MKIVKIDGGLGNQLFCYAFMVALREETRCEVMMDTSSYDLFSIHNGFELERLFNLSMRRATTQELKQVTRVPSNVFWKKIYNRLPPKSSEFHENFEKCYPAIFKDSTIRYYVGNWQWYKYFHSYRDTILTEFTFKNRLTSHNLLLHDTLIHSKSSISIHIRRGDYLNDVKYNGLCSLEYYRTAIEIARLTVEVPCTFVIFSNDIAWCREHLTQYMDNDDVIFVYWNTGLDSYNDLRLMSACRINIIANSSFSWWAAYLNTRSDKSVIAPKVWINLPLEYRIPCDDWYCI